MARKEGGRNPRENFKLKAVKLLEKKNIENKISDSIGDLDKFDK